MIFVPLVLNPFPFTSVGVSVLLFFITSTQSSLALTSLVAIYPTIPLDVIILLHTYSFCVLSTSFSVLVTIAPLAKDAKAAELVVGDFLTVKPSVQIILN
jgi:hypothetical protein